MSEEVLTQYCRKIVRSQLEKNKWRLLSEERLFTVTYQSLQSSISFGTSSEELERQITYQVKGCYAEAWYNMCKNSAATYQREQAYIEISRMLYGFAVQRWTGTQESAQDIVQQSLLFICTNLEKCHKPRAFIAFIFNAFRRCETTYIRKLPKNVTEIDIASVDRDIDESSNKNDRNDREAAIYSYLPKFESEEPCTNLWEEWYHAFVNLFGIRPRADRQLCALYYLFWGWSDEEIAQFLGIDLKRLYELRSLGKKLVNNDDTLKELTIQLLDLQCWQETA